MKSEKISNYLKVVPHSILALSLSTLLLGCGGDNPITQEELDALIEEVSNQGSYSASYKYDGALIPTFESYKLSLDNDVVTEEAFTFNDTGWVARNIDYSSDTAWYLLNNEWKSDDGSGATFAVEDDAILVTNSSGVKTSHKPIEVEIANNTIAASNIVDIDGYNLELPAEVGATILSLESKGYTFEHRQITNFLRSDVYNYGDLTCPNSNCNYVKTPQASPATTFDEVFFNPDSEATNGENFNEDGVSIQLFADIDEDGVGDAKFSDGSTTVIDSTWKYETIEGQKLIIVTVPDSLLHILDNPGSQLFFAIPDGYVRTGIYIPADTVSLDPEDRAIDFNEAAYNDLTAALVEHFNPALPTQAGTEAFQVIDKELVMKSTALEATDFSESIRFGMAGNPSIDFNVIEGDLALLDDQITGDARARTGLILNFGSDTSTDTAQLYMAIDHRAAGITSRVYININGAESEVTELRKTLVKDTAYKFKVESLGDIEDFVAKVTLGNFSYNIPATLFAQGIDLRTREIYFFTNVKNPQAGDFSKASLDNVIYTVQNNGGVDVISRDFDTYADGEAPAADTYFNMVYTPTP